MILWIITMNYNQYKLFGTKKVLLIFTVNKNKLENHVDENQPQETQKKTFLWGFSINNNYWWKGPGPNKLSKFLK